MHVCLTINNGFLLFPQDVLRGLEAHPLRIAPPTQIPSSVGLVDEETQFLDANG